MEIIFTLDEIDLVAKKFISFIKDYKVITFNGELGAGKTTFIIALCKELGVEEVVASPTYAIIHEYHYADSNTLFHIDLYRIKDAQEAIDAGIEDCILSKQLCLIEWPERASVLLPETTVNVFIQPLSENERKLIVQLPQ